ncbi:MAG TPA: hypothetical protein PL151_20820, partial [Phycisphaerae bacterium]|nr:hypothetical protein [Phycisphaerae bacterium]HPP27680.1 hypothetical protein [Phycisphaerae bacterium]HPU27935.1 hypothetical protein [Phycisphaerae bacterium]HQE30201.1 hypothetical protein [Phycisphaerae bacterium]
HLRPPAEVVVDLLDRVRRGVTFAEVKLSSPAIVKPDGIELRLPGNRCVVVRPGFDRQTLIDLLAALETGPDKVAASDAGAQSRS